MIARAFAFALVLAAALAGSARADLKEGLSWMGRGQYHRAYDALKESAEKGDALSARVLGSMLMRTTRIAGSETFEARPEESARWLRVAADMDDKPAARMLASLYAGGYGVARDAEKSLDWFGRAGMALGTFLDDAGKYASGAEQREIAAWMAAVACNNGHGIDLPRRSLRGRLGGTVDIEVDAVTRSTRVARSDAGDAITNAVDVTYARALDIAVPPESAVRHKVKTTVTVKVDFTHAD